MVANSILAGNSYLQVFDMEAISYCRTMRPKDIRRNNLRLLISEAGSIAEVARRSGASEKYLGQLIGEVEQQGTVRGMGDRTAKKLEDAFGKGEGWMDKDHASTDLSDSQRSLLETAKAMAGKLTDEQARLVEQTMRMMINK